MGSLLHQQRIGQACQHSRITCIRDAHPGVNQQTALSKLKSMQQAKRLT